MNIGLDIMGGDFAPNEAIKGLNLFLQENNSAQVTCFGTLEACNQVNSNNVNKVICNSVINYHEHPTKAFKEKQDSSIAVGFQYLSTHKIDAFISAGNTGAMLVGSMFSLKSIPGVLRPTIGTVIPKENGSVGILADVGLNADCKPEQLSQFATLASIYAKEILNIPQPKTGLLNIGEEEGKGNTLAQTAFNLLKENNQIAFIGNIEGRDLFNDKADVMICDGFTGNIVLKMAESFYEIAHKRKFANDEFISRFHYENYGGTPILGIAKPVIIGHGISTAKAFKNMLHLAAKMLATNVCSIIENKFATTQSLK